MTVTLNPETFRRGSQPAWCVHRLWQRNTDSCRRDTVVDDTPRRVARVGERPLPSRLCLTPPVGHRSTRTLAPSTSRSAVRPRIGRADGASTSLLRTLGLDRPIHTKYARRPSVSTDFPTLSGRDLRDAKAGVLIGRLVEDRRSATLLGQPEERRCRRGGGTLWRSSRSTFQTHC